MKILSLWIAVCFALASQTAYAADICSAYLDSVIAGGEVAAASSTDVAFSTKSDRLEEHTIRKGNSAAHIYLDSGLALGADSAKKPYLFMAFPAGNSGVALWFKSKNETVNFEAIGQATAATRENGLNGAEIEIKTGVKSLVIDASILGSMRFIRDRELGIKAPAEVDVKDITLIDGKLFFKRKSLNGKASYLIEIEASPGTLIVRTGSTYKLVSETEVQFKLGGFTSETPLTPIPLEEIFEEEVLRTMNPEQLMAFSFLLYEEKLMAGAPRYHSKFGRDAIYSLRVLMNVMKPAAIEKILNSTISSMHPKKGIVSHEQHEGDFVSFVRKRAKRKFLGINIPLEDYKMIDDDFAFVTVLAEYMKRFPERSSAFLDGVDARGLSRRTLVQKLFAHVKKSTAAFAKDPSYQNLIGLHGDEKTGEWRDSRNGIGGGKYPYAVNAALVPAAIKAIAELSANPQSEFYNPSEAIDLEQRFEIWNTKVIPLFEVRVSAARAALLGSEFLTSLGLDPAAFPAPSEDIVFQAISIDKDGKKVRIMHSDDSLMMTFGHPSEAYLKQSAQRFKLGFPYGLVTPVGVLVANPVFASQRLKAQFNETKYHGRVSWKMQEDLLVFGIHRQLERADLTAQTKRELARSEAIIEKVVAARKDEGGTEVFSIVFKNGRFKAVPFDGDAKSNSNQLWSHLRLAFNRLKQAAVR